MSMLKKLFSKKNPHGVVDVEENTQGSKKKKPSKHTKKNKKNEEHQPNPPQGGGHGDAVAQEEEEDDDDSISKASEAEPTNSDAEAGKLERGEEGKVVVLVEQGDAPVEKTVSVIEESRVRVSEEVDSSASREPEARVSPIAEADKAVDFAKPEASPITEVPPRGTSAADHATWWNCCEILDAFVGSK